MILPVWIILFSIFCVLSVGALEDTMLMVELEIDGEYTEDGDIFIASVTVNNVGDHFALMTFVNLEDVPVDWEVWPPNHFIYSLPASQSSQVHFIVERNAEDAIISASALAYNALISDSNEIPIPVEPWVILGLVSIFGIVVISKKRRN